MDNSRDAVSLQLERWRMRAARAHARRSGQSTDELDAAIDDHDSSIDSPDERHERMRGLESRLGLDRADVDLVWWTVACSLDPDLVRANDGKARRSTLAAFLDAADLDPEVARELACRLVASHPLIAHELVRVHGDDAPTTGTLIPSPRLIAWLLGDDTPSDGVERVSVQPEDRAQMLYDLAQLESISKLADLVSPWSRVMVMLDGPPRTGRRCAVAFAATRPVLLVDFDRLAPSQIGGALRALRRELALVDAVPLLANPNSERDAVLAVRRFIDDQAGPVVVTAQVAPPTLQVARPVVRVAWKVPDTAVRRDLWVRALHGHDLGKELDNLALRYRLGPGGISRAVESARASSSGMLATALGTSDLVAGVRHNIAEGMSGLATRIEVTQTWDDLVLSEDTRDQVGVLVSRLRHSHLVLEKWGYREKLARGTGVAALFSGPPGTGKTMCAGLIARELDLELYQVDLSQVVSKWIGETEKQLSRVFDSAEAGHALLLFDEADALFGQRSTETKGATDRYANMEVNFLLQRIESFGGITILTTNLDAAIDKALKRRLAGHIVFETPDDDERADLWRRLTKTASAPLAPDIDYTELADVFAAMTGANIRNAAIAAAFYAARDESSRIEHAHLLRAGRAEYRSMGHVLADRSRSGRTT